MVPLDTVHYLLIVVFVLGYLAIIFEHTIKVNKAATALLMATISWLILLWYSGSTIEEKLGDFAKHVADVSQIVFFLLGAMTLVELIDIHKGFKIITDKINTRSKKKMLFLISIFTFFLSSILDNLTTTIVLISLIRKLIPEAKDRMLLGSLVVIAANAGGVWTPIGDVTTTMLWLKDKITTLPTITYLFLPSAISLLVCVFIFSFFLKGHYPDLLESKKERNEPGAKLIFYLGIASLISVPIFKAWVDLPGFMGVFLGVGLLWLLTDFMHYKYEERKHLRLSYVLSKLDISAVLFFLGILLTINSLETMGVLQNLAQFLGRHIGNMAIIATLIGLISAIVDNVPLVAGAMGMYPIAIHPTDSLFWQMIAYCAGTGGSILIIGSAAGVAFMGMEKIDFLWYLKRISLIALIGYFAGILTYILMKAVF